MSNIITSNELLINMRSFPVESSSEYRDFWIRERNKCIYGIIIDGVYLPGFLYWHLNYFKCQLDVTKDGKKLRVLGNPYLRDNEWKINQYLKQAEENGEGLLIVGTRRLAKSVYEESYISYNSTFFQGTENVISGLNQPDIKVIVDGVSQCLRNLPRAFKHGIIQKDPKASITLGTKMNNQDNDVWSTILIRNLDNGKNTEVLAGLSPYTVVIDEVGKGPWLECFSALIPGLGTPDGWRCSPLCFGTSGDMTKAADVKRVFEDPKTYNFLAVEVEDENLTKKRGIFFSGHYAHDFKKDDTPLSEFLGLDSKSHPNLEKINIQVTNFERAERQIDDERKKAAQSEDPKALLKLTMYHPKNTQELFLSDSGNTFPVELCRAQLAKLELRDGMPAMGQSIELYQDIDGIVKHRFTPDKKPVFEFPVKNKSYKEGTIIMYEPPIRDAPFTLYVAGIDPYAQNESATSDSLGAIYIYKRIHTIAGEMYQDQMVAHYVGRPSNMNTWFENARLLLKFYNAYALCENDNITFIQYMIGLNEAGIYLSPKPQFLRDLMPNSTVNREYGINATVKLVNHIHEDLKQYLTEVIDTQRDGNGNISKQILGVTRIMDPMLLKEIIAYDPKEGNYDRLRAFCLALSFAKSMTGSGPIEEIKNRNLESYKKIKKNNSFFSKNIRLFK